MAKRIHLDFLQYLLAHQNPKDHYFNRYFVLKGRLHNEKRHAEKKIDCARAHLTKAGFISESQNNPSLLYITEEGEKFLHGENRLNLMNRLERFTQLFNRKYSAIAIIVSVVISAVGLSYNVYKKPGDSIGQFLSVSIINFKQSIFATIGAGVAAPHNDRDSYA